MTKRRRTGLLIGAIGFVVVVLVAAGVAYFGRPAPPMTLRLREVTFHSTEGMQPATIYGERQIQAEFDYQGPDLTPRSGRFDAYLPSMRLVGPPTTPPFMAGDVVLCDEQGRELARLPSSGNATTRSARAGFGQDHLRDRAYVIWTFAFPPEIDRAKPIRFRSETSFGVLPLIPIEVTMQPLSASPPSSGPPRTAPATTRTVPPLTSPVSSR